MFLSVILKQKRSQGFLGSYLQSITAIGIKKLKQEKVKRIQQKSQV